MQEYRWMVYNETFVCARLVGVCLRLESLLAIMKLCTAGKFLVKRRVHETEAMKSYGGVRITQERNGIIIPGQCVPVDSTKRKSA